MDNIRDTLRLARTRVTSGRLLTDAEIMEVRRMREEEKQTHQAIADHFGIARVTITQHLSGARRKSPT